MNRPLLIDTAWVRPFDAGSKPMICHNCLMENARWVVGMPPNNYFTCAFCFICNSPWANENKDSIFKLVTDVENAMGRKISKDGLILPEEADRILSSIVAISGIAKSRKQKRLSDEGSGTRSKP